ncbi:MAG: asparagine synthetase B [Myxococcales bacterium]|nr:asparagine synthetase B [Myxococcales bacterium]
MSGLIGGWSSSSLSPATFDAAFAALAHRGPDSVGLHRDQRAFIGAQRLSIVDHERGHQPLFNEDGTVAAVLDGEIYNTRELIPDLKRAGHRIATSSDTELLVHLWEEHGPEMCEHLRGMFAFMIWDARQRKLFAARDRLGQKPLFITRTRDGGVLLASELDGLRALARGAEPSHGWSLRHEALYDYLSLGFIPQPETIYHGVHAVPAASWVCYDGQRCREERYWDLAFKPKLRVTRADALEQLRELLVDSVRLRMRGDSPLGMVLSSEPHVAAVAQEASRYTRPGLQTFRVVDGELGAEGSPEDTILRLKLNPRREIMTLVERYGQPYADPVALRSLAVARLLRDHVRAVLTGLGGDAVMGGRGFDRALLATEPLRWLPGELFQPASRLLGRRRRGRRTRLGQLRRLVDSVGRRPEELYMTWASVLFTEEDKRAWWRAEPLRATEDWLRTILPLGLGNLDTQLCGEQRTSLVSGVLMNLDVATMQAGIEGRAPLMDHPLVEFAASLPDELRAQRPLLADLYSVPGGWPAPPSVSLDGWMRGSLRPLLLDTVGQSNAEVRQWLRDEPLDALIDGSIMRKRRARLLYTILVLELWLRHHRA